MNSELVNSLVHKFEESSKSIDTIVNKMEKLLTVLDNLENTSKNLESTSRLSEIEGIAKTVMSINSECEGTLGKITDKSQQFDSYVEKLDQYAVGHENDLKKTITAFTGMVKYINEFNKNIRPSMDEIISATKSFSGICDALLAVSTEIGNLKSTIDNNNETIKKNINGLNESVVIYYKKNMDSFANYLKEINNQAAASTREMSHMNEQMRGLLATNIAFNQMYEKMVADGTTYRQAIEQVTEEWTAENLSKSAFKANKRQSLVSKLFGKE